LDEGERSVGAEGWGDGVAGLVELAEDDGVGCAGEGIEGGVLGGAEPAGEGVAGEVADKELAVGDEDVVAEVVLGPVCGEGGGGVLVAQRWAVQLKRSADGEDEKYDGCEDSGAMGPLEMQEGECPLGEALPVLKGEGEPGKKEELERESVAGVEVAGGFEEPEHEGEPEEEP